MSLTKLSLGVIVLLTAACSSAPGGEDSVGAGRANILAGGACQTSADCASGLECETEVEHGVSTRACKSHGGNGGAVDDNGALPGAAGAADDKGGASGAKVEDNDGGAAAAGACPPGLEPEVEHGVTTCKPHGKAADAGASAPTSPASGGGAAGATCKTNADCAVGLECEVEIENGVTTSTCKAHGGKK